MSCRRKVESWRLMWRERAMSKILWMGLKEEDEEEKGMRTGKKEY